MVDGWARIVWACFSSIFLFLECISEGLGGRTSRKWDKSAVCFMHLGDGLGLGVGPESLF